MLTQTLRIVLVTLFLIPATTADAEDKAAARQAYAEGSKYYDLGQYAEALEAFKRAYWNYEEPTFLFNIAQCHRALGRKREAIEAYRSYLRKSQDARNRQDVERVIADLQAALDREKPVEAPPPTRPPATVVESSPQTTVPADTTHTTLTQSAPAKAEKPTWKKPWVWGVVGGLVVIGAAVGLGVGLGLQAHPPKADGSVAF